VGTETIDLLTGVFDPSTKKTRDSRRRKSEEAREAKHAERPTQLTAAPTQLPSSQIITHPLHCAQKERERRRPEHHPSFSKGFDTP